MTLDRLQLKAYAEHLRAGGDPGSAALPPPAPKKKRNNEEWTLQCAFFTWWWEIAPLWGIWPSLCFHIPNSSFLSGTKEQRAKRGKWANMAGVTAGVPDVLLSVPSGKWSGLYIEFKKPSERTKKNGGLSDAQQEFTGYALCRGYQCAVCYSLEEGRDAVMKYLEKSIPEEDQPRCLCAD